MTGSAGLRIQQRPLAAVGSDWPADLNPLLDRILRGRGLRFASDLRLGLEQLPPPLGWPGLDTAVALLRSAIATDQAILVVGDFDADGATGTAIAVRGLKMLGARRVDFRVPDRLRHGYGLSPALVDELDPPPDLLVTVDQGTTSVAGVARANARGIRVLITDHHLPGEELPAAAALVNPNLGGPGAAGGQLCGAAVLFYVLLALRTALRQSGAFRSQPEPQLAVLLDLIALGTVADLVPLDQSNRVLVEQGLRRIRAGLAQPGVNALLHVAGKDPTQVDASDLGFLVAPRLNAAGRLDDMAIGIRCLLADDATQAHLLAAQLDALNRERRDWQQQMQSEALAVVGAEADRLTAGRREAPSVLVLADAGWHAGVVGLVASKLVERFHRPAFVFAPGGEDGLWRGSARSIPGLHLRDAIALVDARHPGLIARFGGHAMAAGLTCAPAALGALTLALQEGIAALLDADLLARRVWTDGSLAPAQLSLDSAWLLRSAGPYGQQFPPPLFDDTFELLDWKVLKDRHRKLRVRHRDGGKPLDALWFNCADLPPPPVSGPVRLLYALEANVYRELWSVQLRIERLLV